MFGKKRQSKKKKKEKVEARKRTTQCQVRDKPTIEVPIVIPRVGNTVPLRFITDCSGQFGEIEARQCSQVLFPGWQS